MSNATFGKSLLDASDFLRDRRELNQSLLRVVSPLKCRPSPRGSWDKLACDDYQIRNMHAVVPMVRQALSDAARISSEKLARVRCLASFHFKTLEQMALAGHVTKQTEHPGQQAAELMHVSGNAAAAFARWSAEPSSRLMQTLAAESLLEAIAVLESCRDRVISAINEPQTLTAK